MQDTLFRHIQKDENSTIGINRHGILSLSFEKFGFWKNRVGTSKITNVGQTKVKNATRVVDFLTFTWIVLDGT